MKSFNIELSEDELRSLIANAESQIADLRSKLKAVTLRKEQWVAALRASAPLTDSQALELLGIADSGVPRSPSGRVRRGDSVGLVSQLLSDGEARTTGEIAKAIPVAYSTICRVLAKEKEAGKIDQLPDGKWQKNPFN